MHRDLGLTQKKRWEAVKIEKAPKENFDALRFKMDSNQRPYD